MLKNSTQEALAIIFPNSYDQEVPSLVQERLMASIPFASRYRIIDFILSSLVNSGIDNVSIIVKKNYRSLMRHLGAGREWDLSRKHGGLNIVPPFAEKTVKVYNGRIEALASILEFLKTQPEKYVVLTDSNIVSNFDYKSLIAFHKENNADVTVAYKSEAIPYGYMNLHPTTTTDLYYTFSLAEDGRVSEIQTNPKEYGPQNLSMNIYLINKDILIDAISKAYVNGHSYFERDILAPNLQNWKIYGYEYTGYTARISDMLSYFNENMKLLKDENLDALFGPSPVYTRVRDDNPTRYIGNSKVKNSMIADGCVIEGEVENCILFKGVKIGKGTVVKNSILMQDTTVAGNCSIDHVIADKEVSISQGKEIIGDESFPVFIPPYKKM